MSAHSVCGEELRPNEHQVKVAVVYNISRYVTWPSAGENPSAHFTIGIFGQGPANSAWNSLNGKLMNGRTVSVQRITDIDDLATCQIVIIEPSERKNIARILMALKDTPVLTISEIDGFSHYGGMIALRIVNNQMKFEVNLKSVRASRLVISSNLLKLALEIVQ